MESFYSMIYYKTNAMSDELVAIGLFTGGDEGPRVYFSDRRMLLLRYVLPDSIYLSLKKNLNYFQDKIDRYKNEQQDLLLFDPYYSKEELQRLNETLDGSLIYSSPTVVNEWMNEALHNNLVNSLLGEKVEEKKKSIRSFTLQWKRISNLDKFATFEKNKLLTELVADAFIPVKIDLLDLENKYLIKAIDLAASERILFNKLNELTLIQNSLPDYQVYAVYAPFFEEQTRLSLNKIFKKFESVKWMDFETFTKKF